MPDTTPGQRFLQLIQQLGLTKNAFAQSLGKTATVIQHIVDERNKPGYDLLNRVCEVYPNVASDWLLRGVGPMLRDEAPLSSPPASPSATDGIDLHDVPPAPPRRASQLLQPAEVAATLALAAQPRQPDGHAAPPAPAVTPPEPSSTRPVTPGPASPAPAAPPVAASVVSALPPAAAAPAAPSPPLPDPTYLAALLQTQHLQHQLALAEQRNQHLLEQQALMQQLVAVLQRHV